MFTIKELHQYSSKVRRAFLEKLRSLPWETVIKNREASFYSMKDIMLHMIDNEDMIVSGQILKVLGYKRAREWEEYRDMEMIRKHLDEVENRTDAYLAPMRLSITCYAPIPAGAPIIHLGDIQSSP